ncbi:MAG TPA: hypothetical protein VFS89_00365, partial [Nitrosospira sp.]|nr:hypothetical protein [Nitrosospira sp.]
MRKWGANCFGSGCTRYIRSRVRSLWQPGIYVVAQQSLPDVPAFHSWFIIGTSSEVSSHPGKLALHFLWSGWG